MPRLCLVAAAWLALAPGLAFARDVQYDIRVDGMTCPFCAATSERALERMEGVRSVSTDLRAGLITVCADESVVLTDDQLSRFFLERGFTYRSQTRREMCADGERTPAEQDAERGQR